MTKLDPRFGGEGCGRPKGDFRGSARVLEGQLLRVEMESCGGRAAIKSIAQDGDSVIRRMNPDLMGPARDGPGLDEGERTLCLQDLKAGFRPVATRVERTADIFFSGPGQGRNSGELLLAGLAVRDQNVSFPNFVEGELLREGSIGYRTLSKNEDAGSFLIQAVEDGQAGPARLPMTEPVVNPFPRERSRRMGVHSRGLVQHQQMFVLEPDQGNTLRIFFHAMRAVSRTP